MLCKAQRSLPERECVAVWIIGADECVADIPDIREPITTKGGLKSILYIVEDREVKYGLLRKQFVNFSSKELYRCLLALDCVSISS